MSFTRGLKITITFKCKQYVECSVEGIPSTPFKPNTSSYVKGDYTVLTLMNFASITYTPMSSETVEFQLDPRQNARDLTPKLYLSCPGASQAIYKKCV